MHKNTLRRIFTCLVISLLLLAQLSASVLATSGTDIGWQSEVPEPPEEPQPTETPAVSETPFETGFTNPNMARGAGSNASYSYTVSWVSSLSSGTTTGDTLAFSPTQNVSQTATLQINFELATGMSAAAGKVEIRIPLSIFTGRDYMPADTIDVSLPLAPATAQGKSYNYYIDEFTNEIVITNHEAVDSSSELMFQVSYSFMPYQIESGYKNEAISASFKLNGEAAVVADPLTATVTTSITAGSISKSTSTSSTVKYEIWQTAWGTEIANAEDYFYVVWYIHYEASQNCSQPYTVYFDDTLPTGAVLVGAGTSSSFTNFRPREIAPEVYENPSSSTLASTSRYVVVAYPRSMVPEGQSSVEITNIVTARLVGVDGAQASKTSSAAKYTYSTALFTYLGDDFGLTKTNYGGTGYNPNMTGALNNLLNDIPVKIGYGNQSSYSYLLATTSRGYGLTKDEESGAYGEKKYTINLIDDLLYLDGNQLMPGDYSITTLWITSIIEYVAAEVQSSGNLTGNQSQAYDTYAPVQIFYTTDGTTWLPYGEVAVNANGLGYTYTYNGYSGTHSSTNLITLPAGTCGVKLSHASSRYEVEISSRIFVYINPTPHVKSIIAGKSSVRVYNIGTLVVTDEDNVIRNPAKSLDAGTLNSAILARDAVIHGQSAQHAARYGDLQSLSSSTTISKYAGTSDITNDPLNERVLVNYTCNIYELGGFLESYLTPQEAQALPDFVEEQTSGVFYDLLPAGAVVDISSISVKTYTTNNTSKTCNFTVRLVENWQGSGQTMMIVSITVPDGSNYYGANTIGNLSYNLYSGFTLNYRVIYSWQDFNDYGSSLLNSIAYRSSTGKLSSGKTAQASGIAKYEYFVGLNGVGYADDTDGNTVYAAVTTTLNVTTSAQTGFSKKVKAAGGLAYGDKAEVPATGTYTYQLRYANTSAVTASGLVFYDILDAYVSGDADQWKGTFVSVDTAQAVSKGIAPVVYYSTTPGLDPADTTAYANLTNTSIWSTSAPADLSTVTAIAIDLRAASGGGAYTLPAGEAIVCYVTMQAPADFKTYEDIYAYNIASCAGTSTTVLGMVSNPLDLSTESTPTKVSLRSADIEIIKVANPASGTETTPAEVTKNDTITYTLSVTNINKAESMTGVKIEDAIPAGLTVNLADIKYYFGTDTPALVSASARVSMTTENSGQKLVFTISELKAGETINLVIPVTVPATATSGTLYKNIAAITEINGFAYELESDATYHKTTTLYGSLQIGKTVDGTDASQTKEFTFTVTLKDSSEAVLAGSFNYTGAKAGTITSGGTFTLKHGESITITGIPEGTRYTVAETDYTAQGYTANSTGATGTITANVTAQALFENVRNTGGFTIKKVDADDIAKVLESAEFSLKDASGEAVYFTWDAQNKQYVYSEEETTIVLTSGSNGLIVITGLPEGSYALTESKSPASYYTASTDSWAITISAEKVTAGETASWEISVRAINSKSLADCMGEDNVLVVTNEYVITPAKVTLVGKKILYGMSLKDDMFSFSVTNAANEIVAAGTNKANGTISFGEITIEAAGTYTYTISEVDGGTKGFTYDKTQYTVTVVVTDSGDGTFSVTVNYPTNGIVFTNRYNSGVTEDFKTPDIPVIAVPAVPKTGDESMLYSLIAVLGASVILMSMFVWANRKKKQHE